MSPTKTYSKEKFEYIYAILAGPLFYINFFIQENLQKWRKYII